jgi:hypothetical protein
MKNPLKLKIIRRDNKIFIIRITLYIISGSLKCHIILRDDPEKPHSHPWNFTSWLFLGAYREILYTPMGQFTGRFQGIFTGLDDKHVIEYIDHHPFKVIKRTCTELHKIELYRVFGRCIQCNTLGYYTDKKQSWDFKRN